MAKRILVPLDSTVESEVVVDLVRGIARDGGATVRLLHIAPVPTAIIDVDGRVLAYADQETARLEAEGMDYLRTVEIQVDGVPVECAVRYGDPAREILREADAFDADLIAVTTTRHARTRSRLAGGVAEQLLRKAPVPVMVVRPGARDAA